MMLFMMMATTIVSLASVQSQIMSDELLGQATYLDALELFYRARNFEQGFLATDPTPEAIQTWFDSQRPAPTYGYLSRWTSECIQVNESFADFTSKVFRFENGRAFMEAYGDQEACIFLPLEKGGFKTLGVLASPLCISCN